MSIGGVLTVGDVIVTDTKLVAPQRQPDKQESHYCVVVSDKFVFILGKNVEYYKKYERYLIVLYQRDYPWLDQDRYIDCCKLTNYTFFGVKSETGNRLNINDIKRLYCSLAKIKDLTPKEMVDQRIEMSKLHVRTILDEINYWALDNYSKPITEL